MWITLTPSDVIIVLPLERLSVCSEVQMICIWPSWCHCQPLSPASVKSRLVLPFWYHLAQVVPDKGPLYRCCCCCCSNYVSILYSFWYISGISQNLKRSCLAWPWTHPFTGRLSTHACQYQPAVHMQNLKCLASSIPNTQWGPKF